jgi:hypothetical protein
MKTIYRLAATLGMLAFSGAGYALDISPGSSLLIASGSEPNNPKPDYVFCLVNPSDCTAGKPNEGMGYDSLYKNDFDTGEDTDATFWDSYSTTWLDGATGDSNPEGATITYDGAPDPTISCPECYLIVKDGTADPIWYIFDISTWDGKETINLSGFWPDCGSPPTCKNGAISHVDIVGKPQKIPEPGTLALLGIGLFGMGLARRRLAS